MEEQVTSQEEHESAVTTANEILKFVGTDYFHIQQMQKSMEITFPNGRPPQKMTYSKAKEYITGLAEYGMIEPLIIGGKAKPDTYKIRLDKEHRLQYLEFKMEEHEAAKGVFKLRKIELIKMFPELSLTEPTVPPVVPAKKAAPKKAAKKAAKKVVKKK